MNYEELNKEEKNELVATLYADCVWGGELYGQDINEEEKQIVLDSANWGGGELPESIMEKVFGCYDFCKEDFFCNMGR